MKAAAILRLTAVVACLATAACAPHTPRSLGRGACGDGRPAGGASGCGPGPAADLRLLPQATLADAASGSADVRAALARADASRAGIDAARAEAQPTVSVDGGANLASVSPGLTAADPSRSYSYALTASIPLYRGGRTRDSTAAARADYVASIANAKDVESSATLELLLATAQTAREEASLAILDSENRKLAKLRADVAGERLIGAATAVDTGDVDRQAARLAVDMQQSRLQIAGLRQTLLRYRAVAPGALPAFASVLPVSREAAFETALRNNPRLREREAQAYGARARVALARSSYDPNVSLDLSAGRSRTFSSLDTGAERQLEAQVRFSVPLFTGGAREAGVRGRLNEYKAAVLEREAATTGVRAAIYAAFDRLGEAHRMFGAASREQAEAVRLLSGIQTERRLGERSVFDEIRAIQDHAQAALNVNAAAYEVRAAEYTLGAETGLIEPMLRAAPGVVAAAQGAVASPGEDRASSAAPDREAACPGACADRRLRDRGAAPLK